MKHLTAVLVACTALVGTAAMAQDLPTKQGDKAVYFSMNGLGNFGVNNVPVAGTSVGTVTGIEGKYFFRDNTAWRLGLSLSRNKTKNGAGTETTVTQFGIAPGIEFHFVNQDRFTLYYGGLLSYAVNDVKVQPAGGASTTANNQGFGIAALLGAEFYPWQNISLGAEYQGGFMSANKPSSTNWGINSTGVVKLGFHW